MKKHNLLFLLLPFLFVQCKMIATISTNHFRKLEDKIIENSSYRIDSILKINSPTQNSSLVMDGNVVLTFNIPGIATDSFGSGYATKKLLNDIGMYYGIVSQDINNKYFLKSHFMTFAIQDHANGPKILTLKYSLYDLLPFKKRPYPQTIIKIAVDPRKIEKAEALDKKLRYRGNLAIKNYIKGFYLFSIKDGNSCFVYSIPGISSDTPAVKDRNRKRLESEIGMWFNELYFDIHNRNFLSSHYMTISIYESQDGPEVYHGLLNLSTLSFLYRKNPDKASNLVLY